MGNLGKRVKEKKISRALSIPLRIIRGAVKLIFTLAVFLFQAAFMAFAFYYYQFVPYLTVISVIISILVVLIICYTKQNSEYKTLWMLVIMVFPFAGTIMYLLYGYGRSTPKKAQIEAIKAYSLNLPNNEIISEMPKGTDKKLCTLLSNLSHMPAYKDQEFLYFTDGMSLYENMMESFRRADEYIFIESFIFAEGRLLDEVINLLFRKADEGVNVKILYDSIGSYGRIKRETVELLNSHPNIQARAFNRVGVKLGPSLNYRDHRKIVIVDGEFVFLGGTNFADEYVHYIERFGFWRDGGACLSGEIVYPLLYLFCENWYMATKQKLDIKMYKVGIHKRIENKKNIESKTHNYILAFGDTPSDSLDPAYNICMSLFENATKSILISSPYLILDDKMSSALCRAAQSGVRVVVLTPGIPDKKLVYAVTRANYGVLLSAGVEIFEYSPGFNHCKNIVVDDRYALIGSINLDYRSLLLHYEVGAFVIEDKSIAKMKMDFLDAVSISKRISREDYLNRALPYKALQFLLHIIAPLL